MIDADADPKRMQPEAPEQDEASVDPLIPVDIEEPMEPGDPDAQPT